MEHLNGMIDKLKLYLVIMKAKQVISVQTMVQMEVGRHLAMKNIKLKFMIQKNGNLFKYFLSIIIEI